MRPIAAGMLAGLIATAVLSILLVLKAAFGLLPEVSFIALLAEVSARVLGTPRDLIVAWTEHLLIGTVLWGGLFAFTNNLWRRGQIARGIQFALIAWLLMMVFLMPLGGMGLFGLALGITPMLASLLLHIVYGAVLGYYFGRFLSPVGAVRREQAATSARRHHRRRPAHQR